MDLYEVSLQLMTYHHKDLIGYGHRLLLFKPIILRWKKTNVYTRVCHVSYDSILICKKSRLVTYDWFLGVVKNILEKVSPQCIQVRAHC